MKLSTNDSSVNSSLWKYSKLFRRMIQKQNEAYKQSNMQATLKLYPDETLSLGPVNMEMINVL